MVIWEDAKNQSVYGPSLEVYKQFQNACAKKIHSQLECELMSKSVSLPSEKDETTVT